VGQKTSDVVCLVEAGAVVGESPVWVAEEKALYWIDIHRPAHASTFST
jgi:sugar lactone lactonase YvrE